jgi:catechol 2,3-dioxygenase-like lactoylglutathione lyase family enzyme
MRIDALDHFVLTVRDVDATVAFYTRVLGMEAITFGVGRRVLAFGAQKINLHEAGREFEPKALHPTPGAADLCFITSASPPSVLAHLQACGVEVLEGPVSRTGARGLIVSVYFRDPDGNLLEVSSYPAAQATPVPLLRKEERGERATADRSLDLFPFP